MSLGARDHQILTVLAHELHFGRAAEVLGMRQPQLSLRLAQIERVVGLKLFLRRPRVTLTPAGEIIVDAGRRAAAEFNAAVEHARQVERGQVGSIMAAVGSTVMLSDLPLSLQRFRHAYPDVALTLRDMHSAQQWEALRTGLIDVSVTREIGAGRSIRSEILGHQRFVALLPSTHRLAERPQLALAELAGEPFVLFHPSIAPGLHHQINALCIRAGFAPHIAQQADEWYTVLGFVRAGFGVTIALDVFGTIAWSGVEACALADDEATAPVFLCWDQARASSPRDLLVEWLRKDPNVLSGAAI
ncbi:MAG: LysR family transcriptional regulator [Alphaproteobacteria bacterium]|nr:LysR family transcriptional regulator [Alphaproteobacteria bacterium]MDE2014901.1 LysR family transcriptional regulator [Alphaproteobacteria bacterium]MDE2074050.1 LysR family transcriptional regulator [Alphaproteobacteria bacterium]MDE2351868.1 LysR family transcriptional regulator [Alphaproteobacteria bacterium]